MAHICISLTDADVILIQKLLKSTTLINIFPIVFIVLLDLMVFFQCIPFTHYKYSLLSLYDILLNKQIKYIKKSSSFFIIIINYIFTFHIPPHLILYIVDCFHYSESFLFEKFNSLDTLK